MKKFLVTIATVLMSSVAGAEDVNHFPALEAPDVKTAFCNLQDYNAKLTAILNKESIEPIDMVKVHELTYTLENAIARLQQDLAQTAATLEEVHLASEDLNKSTVKGAGDQYMNAMQAFVNNATCE